MSAILPLPETVPIMPLEEAVKVFQSVAGIVKARIENADDNYFVCEEHIKMKGEELGLYRALVIRFLHEVLIVRIDESKTTIDHAPHP